MHLTQLDVPCQCSTLGTIDILDRRWTLYFPQVHLLPCEPFPRISSCLLEDCRLSSNSRLRALLLKYKSPLCPPWSFLMINRILSKVQKSFWSCTHVNSCQNYTLYINLHILLNILSKTRKSIKRLKR